MLHKNAGFPEPGQIVLCTVKKILHNSVFVILDEHENKEGIIHISEIAPGRIRTIREYVREGKKIVCKVLRINQIHNNIELSLRRVNMSVRLKKMEGIKLEEKAGKILEACATTLKTTLQDVHKKTAGIMLKEYPSLHACFVDVSKEGEIILTRMGIEKKVAATLTTIIKQRIKPREIRVIKTVIVKNKSPSGVEEIKKAFKKTMEYAAGKKHSISALYLGSARYRIMIKGTEYKEANAMIEDAIKTLAEAVQKSEGTAEVMKEK